MITKEDIAALKADPGSMQLKILDALEESTNGEVNITDASNPFIFLLEAALTSSANGVIETNTVTKKLYPSLASKKEELYHHISDVDMENMLSVPATAPFVFYINLLEMRNNGLRPDGADYIEMTIPEDTEVTVNKVSFTLLNDIIVKLYDDGKVFIEQLSSDNGLSINNLGVLSSAIITDKQGVEWILTETILKQVKKIVVNESAILASGFDVTIKVNGYYCFSSVNSLLTDGTRIPIRQANTLEVIDGTIPTIVVQVNETNVNFKIPDLYLLNETISGNIELVTYVTNGKIYLPLNKLDIKDYSITFGKVNKNTSTAVITNITTLVKSRSIVDGGVDAIETDELKKYIINNTVGRIDVPINENELQRLGSQFGFKIEKNLDVFLNRVFVASKELTTITKVKSTGNVFMNKAKLLINDIDNDSIIINDDFILLKSNTLFKLENNQVLPLKNDEINAVNCLTKEQLKDYFITNKFFYTPFYYTIDKTEDVVESRIYDLDKPSIDDLRIKKKNNNSLLNVNTSQYGVIKTSTGLKLSFGLIGNDSFNNTPSGNLKFVLEIPMAGLDNSLISIDGIMNPETKIVDFNIETDFYIKDDAFIVKNGTAMLSTKRMMLNTDISINSYLVEPDSNPVYLSVETVTLNVGKRIDYLWNKVSTSFTERQYRVYEMDMPFLHEEDVYGEDPATGLFFRKVDTNEDGVLDDIEYIYKHRKGDPVLDELGNPVYRYRKGDTILDDNDLPIIDQNNNVIRYADILMLEYEYMISSSPNSKVWKEEAFTLIQHYLTSEMETINKGLLDKTKILFKPFRSIEDITIINNNNKYTTPALVSPSVTLYVKDSKDITTDKVNADKVTIGSLLNKEFSSTTIRLADLKTKILKELGTNYVGVKIENLDTLGGLEVLNIDDSNLNRLTLNKDIEIDENNDVVTVYDIKLDIIKI